MLRALRPTILDGLHLQLDLGDFFGHEFLRLVRAERPELQYFLQPRRAQTFDEFFGNFAPVVNERLDLRADLGFIRLQVWWEVFRHGAGPINSSRQVVALLPGSLSKVRKGTPPSPLWGLDATDEGAANFFHILGEKESVCPPRAIRIRKPLPTISSYLE